MCVVPSHMVRWDCIMCVVPSHMVRWDSVWDFLLPELWQLDPCTKRICHFVLQVSQVNVNRVLSAEAYLLFYVRVRQIPSVLNQKMVGTVLFQLNPVGCVTFPR